MLIRMGRRISVIKQQAASGLPPRKILNNFSQGLNVEIQTSSVDVAQRLGGLESRFALTRQKACYPAFPSSNSPIPFTPQSFLRTTGVWF